MRLQWPLYTQPDLYMCTLPLHTRDQVQVSIGDWEELCGGGVITTKQGIETGGDDMVHISISSGGQERPEMNNGFWFWQLP